jgi:antitoxin (DNA-binding transcriptional repressor) of toxin-antitoxin stability system
VLEAMTEELWIEAAATDLHSVLQAAARGVVTVLTDSGQPVARVLPGQSERDRQSLRAALQELEEIRTRTSPGPESVSDLIREGQR